MSFWKKLFGVGGEENAADTPSKSVEYNGYVLRAAPYKAEGQYQTAGSVEKEINGERKEHKFIRADRFPSLDAAVEFSLSKGRQIVDEQGDRMFR